MKNNASFLYGFALIIGDFVALVVAFIVAYVLRVTLDSRSLINAIPANEYLQTWLVLLPVWLIIFAFLGLYRRSIYDYRWKEFVHLAIGCLLGVMTVITYDFISDRPIFPARLVPAYGLVVGFLLLIFVRTILRATRMLMWRTGFGVIPTMIIGEGETLTELIKSINHPASTGYRVAAVGSKNTPVNGARIAVFRSYSEAIDAIGPLNIHTVIVAGVDDDSRVANEALAAAQANHAAYKFVPTQAGMLSNNIDVELFQGLPVVSVHQTPLSGWGRIAKRLFDIVASGLAIILLSPLFACIAIGIRLSDWGPAIFKQKRLSRFNTTIEIYKFRTLKMETNGLLPEEGFAKLGKPELAKTYRQNGDFLEDDPRISRFGKFLRKTSLDELPQLLNVLRGDISLVGPRALVPRELKNYPYKDLILSVKSGITGLAQISGRKDISFDERRALDLYYVQNWTFWLDIKILFRTVIDVLFGRGAK